MAISKVPSSGITADFDNSLTTADLAPNSVDSSELVDGSIDTSHIADDQVTGAKLANDIAISTTGAITTTGAFTSVGIDDNADATAITIDSSENVGIGITTSITDRLHVKSTAADCRVSLESSTGKWAIGAEDGDKFGILNYGTSTPFMIDASGNVLLGTTGISTGTFKGLQCAVDSGGFPNYLSRNPSGASGRQWGFGMNSANEFVVYGYNGTNFNSGAYIAWSGTSWTASSDERKKDIIEPITDATTKVNTLRAVIGKYKTDEEDKRRSFLIAQDVQAVLPEAVEDSNPDDLGLQYTEVIPLLVASIKELSAKNDSLETENKAMKTRLDALEARLTAVEAND